MTPRDPDRFEAKARHVTERCRYHDPDTPVGFSCQECIAAALRREHDAALDEAAQNIESVDPRETVTREEARVRTRLATRLRALASPAAAPAADYDPITAPIPEGDMNGPHGPAPAAEGPCCNRATVIGNRVAYCPDHPRPATPSEPAAPAPERDLFAARLATQLVYARARIAEIEAVLQEAREMVDVLAEGHAAELVARIDALLAARTSPPGAGEGT